MVEAVAIVVYEGAAAACKVVLLEDSDSEASFGQTSSESDTAGSGAWNDIASVSSSSTVSWGNDLPTMMADLGFSIAVRF